MLKVFKTYYHFVWQYRLRYVVFVLVGFFAIGLESMQPYFYKLFVDSIEARDLQAVWWILGVLLAVRISSMAFDTVMKWLADKVIIPVARDIRLAVFRKIQALDFAYHTSRSTGSLISAFKRGDSAIFSIHHIQDIGIFNVVIHFLVMMFFLSQVHLLTASTMSMAVVINLLATYFLVKYNIKTRTEFNTVEDQLSGQITDNLINFETVKLFAKENYELEKLKSKFRTWTKKLWKFAISFRLIDLTVGFIGNLSFGVVMGIGVWQLHQNTISAGDFVMVLGFLSHFYYQFFELTFRMRELAKFYVDAHKYLSILEEKELVRDPTRPTKLKHVRGDIVFDKVGFTYGGRRKALRDFSLRIKPGQTVALVGQSGAGKSTVVRLLLRFFDLSQGNIKVDGINITDLKKSALRSKIGVVPQEPILFNSTIRENICYGSSRVDEDELIAASKMANAYDFINDLPQKFETKVGERGIKLSGGQKQRLAIARMMISNPKIVIFDEATSQLDSESERQIQEAFWKATKNKTTLVIAHRLSTVVSADKIVVMENGKIIEEGSHRDLLNRGGQYTKFWELQSLG